MFTKKNEGAILLEIAVGISIMGIIAGALAAYFTVYRKSGYSRATRENIETVTAALAGYLSRNSRLPRAADDNSGGEGQGGGKFVPYKALEIPEKCAKDGEGKLLFYMVEPGLTENFDGIYLVNDDNSVSFSKSYFCEREIAARKISLRGVKNDADIAFVIDTQNKNIFFQENNVCVNPSEYTMWITRDMLLMKYLKDRACRSALNGVYFRNIPSDTEQNPPGVNENNYRFINADLDF